jgi:hypothetical protein
MTQLSLMFRCMSSAASSPSAAAIQAWFDQTTPSVTIRPTDTAKCWRSHSAEYAPMGNQELTPYRRSQANAAGTPRPIYFPSLAEISQNGTEVQQASLQRTVSQDGAGNANCGFTSTGSPLPH